MHESTIGPEWLSDYPFNRVLPDGRVCVVSHFLYTAGILIDCHQFGYEDRFCYKDIDAAWKALQAWSGDGEPEGWHRHPSSGRRRDETGKEWINR